MTVAGFEEDPPGPADDEADAAFILRLDAYDGPIDVLLEKARAQKVDLTQISILALADQYLAFVERARRLRLDLAADYLVMAAWLAYLKSRLLLPAAPGDEEPSGEAMAAALAHQLRRIEAMRKAGRALLARPQLGQDVFARGRPEAPEVARTIAWTATLHDLLTAYAGFRRRTAAPHALRVEASQLYAMSEALERLGAMLGAAPDWIDLTAFLPPPAPDPLVARSALAAHFAACLELTRAGRIRLRQDAAFGPILVQSRAGETEGA